MENVQEHKYPNEVESPESMQPKNPNEVKNEDKLDNTEQKEQMINNSRNSVCVNRPDQYKKDNHKKHIKHQRRINFTFNR